MFEYLMPMLVMPTYENTLLDLSCKSAVARQIQYLSLIHICLVPFALVFLLLLGWLLFPKNSGAWGILILSIIVLPSLLAVLTEFLRKPKDLPFYLHLRNVGDTLARQMGQTILTVAFLPYDAGISLDAVSRTLWRLIFTRRHLLEWQTSDDNECDDKDNLQSFYAEMCIRDRRKTGRMKFCRLRKKIRRI